MEDVLVTTAGTSMLPNVRYSRYYFVYGSDAHAIIMSYRTKM